MEFFLRGRWTLAPIGSVVFMPRNNLHAFRNIGSNPSHLIISTMPSGFERFFAASAVEFAQPGGPKLERLIAIGAQHGIYFPTLAAAGSVPTAITDRPPLLVRPSEGRVLRAFGEEINILLDGAATGGQFTCFVETTPPGGGPPPHFHDQEDEWFYILEGEFRFFVEGRWAKAGPGSAVFAPRKSVHTFQNTGATPGRMLVHVAPSGFENFFAAAAELFAQPTPPDLEKAVALAASHGIHFVKA